MYQVQLSNDINWVDSMFKREKIKYGTWNAQNPDLWRVIFSTLDRSEKSWSDIWDKIRGEIGSKTTLSLYLKTVVREGHVRKTEDGKYSLILTPLVRTLLGKPLKDTIVYSKIEQNKLYEKEFLDLICCSSTQLILNILHGYILQAGYRKDGRVGEEESLNQMIKGFIANLSNLLSLQGRYVNERLDNGTFYNNRLLEAKKEVMNEMREKSLALKNKIDEREYLDHKARPLKTVIGTLRYDDELIIQPEDFDLQKMHIMILNNYGLFTLD